MIKTTPVHFIRLFVSSSYSHPPFFVNSQSNQGNRTPIPLARCLSNNFAQGRSLASAILGMGIPTNSSCDLSCPLSICPVPLIAHLFFVPSVSLSVIIPSGFRLRGRR